MITKDQVILAAVQGWFTPVANEDGFLHMTPSEVDKHLRKFFNSQLDQVDLVFEELQKRYGD